MYLKFLYDLVFLLHALHLAQLVRGAARARSYLMIRSTPILLQLPIFLCQNLLQSYATLLQLAQVLITRQKAVFSILNVTLQDLYGVGVFGRLLLHLYILYL